MQAAVVVAACFACARNLREPTPGGRNALLQSALASGGAA